MSTFELKPCPFCGGTPVNRHSSGDERDGYADHVSYTCQSCGCSRGAKGKSGKGGYADNSKVEAEALAKWNTRAPATTCPGHGRSECVSCCWPKGAGPLSGVELGRQLVEQVLSVTPENYAGHSFGVSAPDGSTLGDVIITVVKPDGKGPHELRVEAESRVTELANLLTLARPHVPVTDPLRGLINANLFQHLVEQDPSADFKDAAPVPAAYTAVDMGTAAADGYRDGVDNVEPEWVVNSIAELGVKVEGRFYFLYKGASLEYTSPEDEYEKPLMWRPVFKREFGEVCTPINRYAQGLIGTVSLEDSDEWLPLPARSVSP